MATTEAIVAMRKDPGLNAILVDAKGRTLYLFTRDERNKSNCSDSCARNWPPLTAKDAPKAGEGVPQGLLSTITRADGSTQIAYNGWPLYYFAADQDPGDTKGQNVGNVWYVVSLDGGPIQNSAQVNAKSAPLGTILTDLSGRTLYMFTKDEKNTSNCSGQCAQRWPPMLTKGDPKAGEGVAAGMLGTITRADGSIHVTYNGMPLYYWYQDDKPGDTKGQNVGGVWYVVNPAGEAVKAPASGM